jgi:phosphoglycolate phosphatase
LKKIVIYDCDGVLFDSREANEAFYNHILERFGMPRMREEQLGLVHVSTAKEAIDYLFDGSPYREAAHAYRETMDYSPFIPLMRLEPHVRETLARIRRYCRTAIATNRGYSMLLVLQAHRLEDLFDLTVTSLDVDAPKPHPECLLKILGHFGLEARDAVYIGDAEVDRLVAQGSGVCFAAYKNPGLEADLHLDDHREVLRCLGRDEECRQRNSQGL